MRPHFGGIIRTMQVYRRAMPGSSRYSFLCTHPGGDERIERARTVAKQRGATCG